MTLYGILDVSVWQAILATLAMTHLTIAAVTIYLHRAQAHRAIDLHPAVAHVFRFWLWLTTGMVTREWVAVHRRHHAKVETDQDPHSPKILGLGKVMAQGAEIYRAAARDPDTLTRYGHATPDDWLERRVYSRFTWQGLALMLILDLLLFGVYGPTIWAVQMMWIPFWAAGVINGVGHAWGYRSFESADASTNIVPWGILVGGRGAAQQPPRLPQLGAALLQMVGAGSGLGLYPRAQRTAAGPDQEGGPGAARSSRASRWSDMETLRAVVVSRMHVFARYTKDVLKPVTRAGAVPRHRPLPTPGAPQPAPTGPGGPASGRSGAYPAGADPGPERDAGHGLPVPGAAPGDLGAPHPSQEALLHSLQDWCRQAESTGIQALEQFAQTLRGFSLKATRQFDGVARCRLTRMARRKAARHSVPAAGRK